jgi:lipoprotein-anchoring transpeptidase ErfK/SrfK
MNKSIKLVVAIGLSLSVFSAAHATESTEEITKREAIQAEHEEEQNALDELNPFDLNIEEKLRAMDQEYYQQTGQLPYIQGGNFDFFENKLQVPEAACKRETCAVFVRVDRSEQLAYVYVNGVLEHTWSVSTGLPQYETPNLDTRPNGRIYDKYSSSKYPGGDYQGLGNMPYAIFISGGFAIHGTVEKNFPKLGSKASHGCIRLHSDNGFILNRLVRAFGIQQTWFKVEE